MKTDEELKGLFRRMLEAPATCAHVFDHAIITLKSEFAPLYEQLETYKDGLHQAKFEYQCLRADLGHEQQKYDQLRTAVETVIADMSSFSSKDCVCERCVTCRAWVKTLHSALMPLVPTQAPQFCSASSRTERPLAPLPDHIASPVSK